MVFFYKVYKGYIGGSLYSANSSIGYCKGIVYGIVQGILKGICSGYSEKYLIRISIGYRGNPCLEILEEDRIPPIDFPSYFKYCPRKRRKIGNSFKYTVLIMFIISFLCYTKWNTLYNTFMEKSYRIWSTPYIPYVYLVGYHLEYLIEYLLEYPVYMITAVYLTDTL